MTDQGKFLKKSLEDATKNVEEWPTWKKDLESATTESQYSRKPIVPQGESDSGAQADKK